MHFVEIFSWLKFVSSESMKGQFKDRFMLPKVSISSYFVGSETGRYFEGELIEMTNEWSLIMRHGCQLLSIDHTENGTGYCIGFL